jgi:hypothetical protein
LPPSAGLIIIQAAATASGIPERVKGRLHDRCTIKRYDISTRQRHQLCQCEWHGQPWRGNLRGLQRLAQRQQPHLYCTTSAGFNATFTTSLPMGATFPGKFKLCATNSSTTNNTRITMSITIN